MSDPWRTLIVEDDPVVAEVHRRLVARTPGFAVVGVAATAAEALRLLPLKRPQLVLLDLGLPDHDGIALLRALRRAEAAVEVIAITAARDSDSVRDCVHLGVVDYLVKPFTPERLQEGLIRFRDRILMLRAAALDQSAVDAVAGTRTVGDGLPRDLAAETLAEVRSALQAAGEGLTAAEVATLLGLHRVTARRYLEYLVTVREAESEAVAVGPGRPRKSYRSLTGAAARIHRTRSADAADQRR
ncbi:response regulator [Patulibacter defluvii]|uniref:response regulator n=1 Tax=Patulibacter defluvii TaxID=3095358 RepID=UPI002A7513B2|nr:response regulator [Patulibacter sp. DM4]